jgi:hypothetical protein
MLLLLPARAQRLLLSCHLVGTLNTVYFARAMPRELCDRVRQQARRALLRIFMMRLVRESVSVSAQSLAWPLPLGTRKRLFSSCLCAPVK